MLVIFLMLMCTVSLTLHGTIDVTVRNQYSDIELASPAYFCNCGTCHEYPVERMDDGIMMSIGFRFDLDQDEPEGILMYEMQRKRNIKSNYQSNVDTTSIEAVDGTSKVMRFLVAWKVDRSWNFRARTILVAHDNEFVLNEDRLKQLHSKIYSIPSEVYFSLFRYDGILKSTWLIGSGTVLEATYEAIHEKGFELKITISEGNEDKYTKSVLWIGSKRQVSSEMI
jgi:hypothetical protein